MEPRCVSMLMMIMVVVFGLAKADVAKDREQCTNQLIALSTCLQYVSDDSVKAPTPDCCKGLQTVLQKSKVCLCILVKDRNDPSLGLKINVTRALGLPDVCHSTDANIGECPTLLNLPANSPDAKVFEDYVKEHKGTATSTNANSTVDSPGSSSGKDGSSSAKIESDGGRGKLGVEKLLGLLLIVALLLSHLT